MATRRRRVLSRALLFFVSLSFLANFVIPPEAKAALLPALPAAPTLDDVTGVLGITNVEGGLAQTTNAVNEISAAVNGLGVTLLGTPAPDVDAQVAAIQAAIDQVTAEAAALDVTGAQDAVMAAVSSIQSQILSLGLSTGLSSGLQVAQNVLSPVCALTAVPTSFVPGLGLDLTRTYRLARPTIRQVDRATDRLIKDTYDLVYAQVLALLGANATTAAVPALLSLLQFNWTTTYQAPDGTVITKSAPGLINLPTPIDVDNSGTFDVCAMAGFATGEGGSVIMKQTITKMPLSKATLPLKIEAPMVLGLLTVGYDTTTQPGFDTDVSPTVDNSRSTAPVSYSTTTTYASTGMKFQSAVAVHRGTTLTLPPAEFNPLPALPTLKPLTEPAPTPKITQALCLVSCGLLQTTNRFDSTPNTWTVNATAPAAAAQNLSLASSARADLFRFAYTTLGGLAVGSTKAVPAPTSLTYCARNSNGDCSTSSHKATDTGSLNFLASTPTKLDSSVVSLIAPTSTCTLRQADTHIEGTRLTMSNTPATATTPGKVFVDTGNTALTGCVGFASSATGIPAATFPAGFKASGRDTTYHLSGSTLIPDIKAGTATCPAGTGFTQGSSTAMTPVVCPVLPSITDGPTISGEPVVEGPLTANSTWSPVANTPTVANSPTLSYQWLRCDASGVICGPVSGATSSTYLPVADDAGHAFKVTVTGVNADGSLTSLPSAATAPIAAQTEPPANVNLPTISGIAGTGRTLTADSSKLTDWIHGVSGNLAYQWQKCDAVGANCADIVDATSMTYDVAYPADLDSTIQVVVTATNSIGSTSATSAQKRIQPAPINTAAGTIQRCLNTACTSSAAIPGSPFTGDKLKVTDDAWLPGTATSFLYQWLRCDETGANCEAIAGATTNRYTVSKANDLGKTLKATITATNDNLDASSQPAGTSVDTAATAVVTPAKPAVQPAPAVDGIVNSVVGGNFDTTYFGGSFDTAGPAAGGAGAEYLAASGSIPAGAVTNAANVTGGVVKAIASDGGGGYLIGGDFTHVQGVACAAFAHITSAGALDATYCNLGGITGEVRAVALTSGTYGNASGGVGTYTAVTRVALGGAFTAGGRSNLIYIDPTTKAITGDGLGDPNGAVNALVPAGATVGSILGTPPLAVTHPGRLYIGGDFTKVGSTTVNHVFRNNWGSPGPVNQQSSAATATFTHDAAFNPAVCSGAPVSGECPGASVKALALSTGALLVGGVFDGAYKAADAPTPRNNAAAFSLTAPHAVTTWNPNTNGPVNAIGVGFGGSGTVPTAVFLGGSFTQAAGQSVHNVVAYGITSTGAASAVASGQMNAAPSTSWKPQVDGVVYAISAGASSSSHIVIGGAFKTADGQARHRIASYVNQTSGSTAVSALQPLTAHAGNTVYALARDTASRLLAGGAFKVLGGVVRNNVAAISQANGVTSFTANTDGPVSALGANGTDVFLAGSFTKVNGENRDRLAAVSQANNAVTSWTPSLSPGGVVNALTATDDAVYAGGTFSNIGGLSRSSLAALDPATGNATSWNSGGVTGAGASVNSIVLHGSNVLVGGSFTETGGASRSNAAAVSAATGAATSWAPNPDGMVNAITGDPDNADAIFLGGSFANAGGAARANLAKVSAATGNADTWQADTNGAVTSLVVFSNNLYLSGGFSSIGGFTNGPLAGVDATTAEVLDWQPTPSGVIRSMALTTSGLIAIGGDFVTFNPPVTGTNANPVFTYRPGFALLG